MAKAGIKDVAARAGVSIGTVSNVLNKPDQVSAKTTARVRDAMAALGFVPNSLAAQLRAGRGTTIGMVVLDISNPFFADLAHACETAGEALGHAVVFGSSDQNPRREASYIELFAQQRVAGLLIAPVQGVTPEMQRLTAAGTPIVLFDVERSDSFCTVTTDGRAGGAMATRHLIDTGRRNIMFLGGPAHQVEDRWMGAVAACLDEPGVRLTRMETKGTAIAEGREAARRLAERPADEWPDAVFAANDALAHGLMQGLTASIGSGWERRVALVGYDDIEYSASAAVPLTSVKQPLPELASHAVQLLTREADDANHEHQHVLLRPELIVRDSTPRV